MGIQQLTPLTAAKHSGDIFMKLIGDGSLGAITVYGGDFKAGEGSYSSAQFSLKSYQRIFLNEVIHLDRLANLETVSLESNGRDTLSTVGRALVGELIAGPFGAIIAAGTAKARNQVTFLATFDDNRKFLGSTDSETFKSWMGVLLTRQLRKVRDEEVKARNEEVEAAKASRDKEIEAAKAARADAMISRYIKEQEAALTVGQQQTAPTAKRALTPAAPVFGKRLTGPE
jgi:hypothetical protein